MKILLVAPPWLPVPPFAYGGVEWVVGGLADGLVDAGHDVTLVASGGSHTKAQLECVFPEPPFEQLGDVRIETIQALSAYQKREHFDIIHDHTSAVGPALASLGTGPPVVHTLHNPWNDEQASLIQLTAPPVHLVAISHDQAARAPEGTPIAAVIHNGIPVDRYPFSSDKEDYLLFVGRAHPEKGPNLAIEIAQRLGRPLIMAIKINQADEFEYWANVLQPLVRSAGVPIEVARNPEHEQKADLMRKAAVLVVPIQWAEPFGLVMPEANACGTPVVAFAAGAAPEVIAHGKTGFVVPPGDIDAFCVAVEKTTELAALECRAHVAAWFGVERMVAEYLGLFEELAAVARRVEVSL